MYYMEKIRATKDLEFKTVTTLLDEFNIELIALYLEKLGQQKTQNKTITTLLNVFNIELIAYWPRFVN